MLLTAATSGCAHRAHKVPTHQVNISVEIGIIVAALAPAAEALVKVSALKVVDGEIVTTKVQLERLAQGRLFLRDTVPLCHLEGKPLSLKKYMEEKVVEGKRKRGEFYLAPSVR